MLITGSGGQLASELQRTAPAGWDVRALNVSQLDITSLAVVMAEAARFQPALVINAAAYTAVDRAESEPSVAFAVNETGPANLAAAAAAHGFRLIHVSTDFVFDGKRVGRPYCPADTAQPLGTYGASKLAGERRIMEASLPGSVIVRTAWLYSGIGTNFVRTILRLAKERNVLRIVADQVGSPTWARSLAETLWAFAGDTAASGIFHWVDAGEATWHEFAVAIQHEGVERGLIRSPIPIEPITTVEYPLPAVRPAYSVLDCSDTIARLGRHQHTWRQNLRAMMSELYT